MADNNIDVFKMFAAEDRFDGDNYPMWAYMMQHVLVSKGIWNIVQGIDVRLGSVDLAEVGQDTANTIYIDSQSALAVARNPIFHARTKHIKVHYHYVRERLSAREISLAYVPTQDNLADLFTKALSREKLEAFRKALGLLPFVD
ncbi:hypothetical protein L7F22_065835 [Adiantum nelumboides]|nr:hypothetical protein [Adiantum nelumboides]